MNASIGVSQRNSLGRGAWRYLRHELLYIAWALTETALIGCLAVAVTPWARYWPVYQLGLLLFVLILIPFNMSRLLEMAQVSHWRRQAILAGLLLPVLFVALNQLLYASSSQTGLAWLSAFYARLTQSGNPFWIRDVTVIILVTLCWARGISLTGREVDIDRLGLRLRVGALIVTPLLIALAGNQQAARVAPFVLLFFLSSLIAVALTRAEQIERDEAQRSHAMSGRWFAIVAAASLTITLIAGIFAAITGSNPLLFLNTWLGPLWLGLHFAGTVAIAAFTFVAQPFLVILDFLISALINLVQAVGTLIAGNAAPPPPTDSAPDFSGSVFDALIELLSGGSLPRSFGNLRLILIIVVILLILITAIGLNSAFARRRLNRREDGELWLAPEDALPEANRLRRLWQRLSGSSRRRVAASIRRIYRQMCDAADACGYPRLEAETPYEYLASLSHVWPQGAPQTALITHAYVRARYGEIPETREELAQILAAWRHLLATLPEKE